MENALTEIVVLFGAALLAAWLMRILRAPAILGFLIAGILIGPSGLNLIAQQDVHFFAELGLVLLLFVVGLELSVTPLVRSGRGCCWGRSCSSASRPCWALCCSMRSD